MRNSLPFSFPEITDDDIDWACRVMELPENAFDQARKEVLLSRQNLDVAACPGSGKTTLLVAKLAILARKWTDRRRGICVLSHTNAAREVIEERLGSTAEGQTLLSYPHYVGTIHGFVDRFLGIPWLKACGFPVTMIDTEVALGRRWWKLPFATRSALENKRSGPGVLKIDATDFSVGDISWGRNGTLDRASATYQNIMASCRQTSEAGYFCYEDPFLWGRELTEVVPETIYSLRDRFPILFVDEAQDNSELQSNILHRVFVDEDAGVVSQRFGDANQAIYHSMNSQDAPTTWVFPDDDLKHDIPDSHRFGQTIANFATPLGVEPQTLTGLGPDQRRVIADVDDQHTIFLFDEQAREHVLPAYANHLRSIFDDVALGNGSFVAVGAKHKKPDNENNKPNSVCDYWKKYDPEQSKTEPRPKTFVGYVQVGRSKLEKDTGRNLHSVVEQIATGLLEAVRQAGGKPLNRQRKSRYIREILTDDHEALENYIEFLRRFAVDGEELTEQLWNGEWKDKISAVAVVLFDEDGGYQSPEAFLAWPEDEENNGDGGNASTVYQQGENLPKIRLGSIHSVKGETHTGILILETFNISYSLKAVKRWLLGNIGTEIQRNGQSSRLKVHYVAMTRPTHLLCLAVPEGTFTDEDVSALSGRDWRIARIDAAGAVTWEEMEG